MTIMLQVLFSFMVALIVVHAIGWVIRKINAELFTTPKFIRGVYTSAAVCSFILSFHEINHAIALH